jgi:hypothetical protein
MTSPDLQGIGEVVGRWGEEPAPKEPRGGGGVLTRKQALDQVGHIGVLHKPDLQTRQVC